MMRLSLRSVALFVVALAAALSLPVASHAQRRGASAPPVIVAPDEISLTNRLPPLRGDIG